MLPVVQDPAAMLPVSEDSKLAEILASSDDTATAEDHTPENTVAPVEQ